MGMCKFFIGETAIIDKNEFKNEVFQCVFQYLRRYDAMADLSDFIYQKPSVEGDYTTCICTITKFVLFFILLLFSCELIIFIDYVVYFNHLGQSLHSLSDFCMSN